MVVVLCGSMKFKEDIINIGKKLEDMGYSVLLPVECINGEPKEIASRAHFNRIISEDTEAILVVNNEKSGIANYIGPNSFAEVAFAFFHNKKIFLLNDIYEPFRDELEGWKAITLNSKLEDIK